MKRFVCMCGMALALGLGGADVSQSESRAAQSGPAPGEVLRSRAEAYWRLLASGDREATSQLLRPEDRPYFLEHPEPPFLDPGSAGDRAFGGRDPGRSPGRPEPAHAVRAVSMGDPAGLDLCPRDMDGRAAPDQEQSIRIPLPSGGTTTTRRYGMPSLRAARRQTRLYPCPISDDGRASGCWR